MDYIHLCVETTVPTRRERSLSNNKALDDSWSESLAAGKKESFPVR